MFGDQGGRNGVSGNKKEGQNTWVFPVDKAEKQQVPVISREEIWDSAMHQNPTLVDIKIVGKCMFIPKIYSIQAQFVQ